MSYHPLNNRYDRMPYRPAGKSGLKLPSVSLGLWHNFGESSNLENCREMVHSAFDLGITHFDLANNYGPPPGSAEEMFGRIIASDLKPYRDEIVIATKAGYDMWPGPYGNFGSRKYLIASLDQSLRRMGLDYVDIFYHHRPDPSTPLEETMGALAHLVTSGKALYVGVSNYGPEEMKQAQAILRDFGVLLLVNQVKYNMFDRRIEETGLIRAAEDLGVGLVVFSPLAQGVLTDRYLRGIPADSRAHGQSIFLSSNDITEDKTDKVRRLSYLAEGRGQSVAASALAFVLRHLAVASVIVGASRKEQVLDSVKVIDNLLISEEELLQIETILS
jgi:L-glyceraldehyde 3-phosphate reductase